MPNPSVCWVSWCRSGRSIFSDLFFFAVDLFEDTEISGLVEHDEAVEPIDGEDVPILGMNGLKAATDVPKVGESEPRIGYWRRMMADDICG